MAKKTDRKIYTRPVMVQLDEQAALALHDKSKRLAAKADELEEKLKELVKAKKLDIATARAESDRDRAGATAREHLVDMKCYEVLEGVEWLVCRADTDEVVDRRAMSEDERQTEAFPGLDMGGELPLDPDSLPVDGLDEPAPAKRGRKGKAS